LARVPLGLLVVLVPSGSDRHGRVRRGGTLLRPQRLSAALPFVGEPVVASAVIWLAGVWPVA